MLSTGTVKAELKLFLSGSKDNYADRLNRAGYTTACAARKTILATRGHLQKYKLLP